MSGQNVKSLMEGIVLTDDTDWIWNFARQAVASSGGQPLRLQSSVSLKCSRSRLDGGLPIVVDWNCKGRTALALIEEISEIFADSNLSNRVIVIASNVLREDALCFGELGVDRIVILRNRDVDLVRANRDFVSHWRDCVHRVAAEKAGQTRTDTQWYSLLRHVDAALDQFWNKTSYFDSESGSADGEATLMASAISEAALSDSAYTGLVARARIFLENSEANSEAKGVIGSARSLDLEASLMVLLGRPEEALQKWIQACKLNPNYHRAHINLSRFLRRSGRFAESLSILNRRFEQNRLSVRLLVEIGDAHLEANDLVKAEHMYSMALGRDSMSSAALNGLAQVRFASGELIACRDLLNKSRNSARAAARLNRIAIDLVKTEQFEAALDLYNRAQFVLSQQDKDPMLFYNMGLCYWRWGNNDMARQCIKLALIKDPGYEKAKRFLARMTSSQAVMEGRN